MIRLANHEILFPFAKPYQCQLAMMEAVLKSVTNKENALIESPTGTGKTLSILCAAVAALQKVRAERKSCEKDEEVPMKIIFCTRTHSQIEQIFNEIKSKLPY
jgi:regulator of telomere elongation helicase 1